MKFYSPGKLLLSAEYLILDGAVGLALPTNYGQSLEVQDLQQPELIWESFNAQGEIWLQVVFDLPKLRIINSTFTAETDGGNDRLAENLQQFLLQLKRLNPSLFDTKTGYHCTSHLEFPQNWGLGSSSTLINNLSQWAKVNPYTLLENTFKGSGYDIACAMAKGPILYSNSTKQPTVKAVDFAPPFADQLYFVHLNKKKNSRDGIQHYRKNKADKSAIITQVSSLSEDMLCCQTLANFETLLKEHEAVISNLLGLNPIQESHFADYFGQTKSLGAWGGDFILATGNQSSPAYFKAKGYPTVVPFKTMCLCP